MTAKNENEKSINFVYILICHPIGYWKCVCVYMWATYTSTNIQNMHTNVDNSSCGKIHNLYIQAFIPWPYKGYKNQEISPVIILYLLVDR